jgi:hypothetical protein
MRARLILAGLMVAQLADAATFVLGVGMHGIGLEANGFAVALHQVGGTDAVLIAKGAVVVSAVVLLAATAHRFPRLLVLGSASGTSFGLLGFTANVASLVMVGAG